MLHTPLEVTVATDGCDEFQVTMLVKSWVLPSAKLPVADNGIVKPIGNEGFGGVIESETNCD